MIDVKRYTTLALCSLILTGCSGLTSFSQQLQRPVGAEPTDDTQAPRTLASYRIKPDPLTRPAPEPTEPANLWDRMREGFVLNGHDHKRVQQYIEWYASHQRYINRVSERGRRYLYYIVNRLEDEKMPLEFALLPVVESAFDPFAYSHGSASGMWQFISGTAGDYGLKQNWWYDGRRDVIDSTNAAIAYLQFLHQLFDENWLLALAAYNTGQGNLMDAIRQNRRAGQPTDFWSLDLPRETRAYVPQLLALSQVVANPEQYQISLPDLPNTPYFARVEIDSQIDLAQAAELAGISMDELYLLNPGYNRWATAPKGPHRLLLPVNAADRFHKALAQIPANQRITWTRYTIERGDSLSTIANRYNTSVGALQSANRLSSTRIRAGETLLIPQASEPGDHYAYSRSQRLEATQANSRGGEGSEKVRYRVENGDSLWRIANRHQVSVSALARWNGMAPQDTLHPGQKLVIWSEAEQAQPRRGRGQKGVVRKLYYQVRRGDSLASIAGRFNVSIKDIARWNSVSASNYIHPGDSLTLFVDVTRAD